MIKYLEISKRQCGKTERLVEALRAKVDYINRTKRVAVVGLRQDIIDREIKRKLTTYQNSKIVYTTNFENMRGYDFDTIFVDEFDYIKEKMMNEIIDMYLISSDFYFNTTPRKIRTQEEMLSINNDDPFVRIIRLNNYNYHRYIANRNISYEKFTRVQKTEMIGIFMENNENLRMPMNVVDRYHLFKTSSIAECVDNSATNSKGIDTPNHFFMVTNNVIEELIERKVTERLKQIEEIKQKDLKASYLTGIGSGNRVIDI